ncbi:MAG: hypothetical protein KF740_20395, partial [Ramlibacter sp.]|nr:hypothetical protein [Ramlibacter sp.]
MPRWFFIARGRRHIAGAEACGAARDGAGEESVGVEVIERSRCSGESILCHESLCQYMSGVNLRKIRSGK